MVRRIEVSLGTSFKDAAADALLERLKTDFGMSGLQTVRRAEVYSFEEDLEPSDAQKLAAELLSDPVNQHYSVGEPLVSDFTYAIEVGLRPGVKDNVGETAQAAAGDVLGRPLQGHVFTSMLFLFYGEFLPEKAQALAEGVLCNPLIQRWKGFAAAGISSYYASLDLPIAGASNKGSVFEIPLPADEAELERISKRRLLALSVDEMKAIRAHYQEPDVRAARAKLGLSIHPTDVELEAIAQTWSEHCKHKIFNADIAYVDKTEKTTEKKTEKTKDKKKNKQSKSSASAHSLSSSPKVIHSLFKTYIRATTESIHAAQPYLLSVFTDNAGILAMDDTWALAIKVETHNTPSALDPYGGALTGILGVNRDVLGAGMGAKPVFNTDIFCFADPNYAGTIPPRLLHPRRVFEGVRAGVERGGNASGIPTVNGSIYFDNRYLGKPLVYCGTGGLMPRKVPDPRAPNQRASQGDLDASSSTGGVVCVSHLKYHKAGDRIFMVGGRVGKDGIHGATFSSEGLHEGSPTSAVQLGDPITQKNVLDFLLASRDAGLHSGLTDDGAGGLSSSVGEMANDAGGALIHLERCPLKYPGLDPWEILLSESQERMTVAVPADKAGDFAALAVRFGVEATDIGEFESSGFLQVRYHSQVVAHLDLKFLHNGVPKMHLEAEWSEDEGLEEPDLELPSDLKVELLALLARPNICSKESVIRQYDHEVQGMSVIKPLCGASASGPSDAAVLQPIPDLSWGVVASHGLCPRFSDLDPYHMAMLALDEAVRNYVAAGGDPACWGALDNFCWPDPIVSSKNPDGKRKLAALVRTCQGLSEACKAYALPLVSGKDSMKNDYAHGSIRISVPPTLLVSLVGRIDDVERAVASDFKKAGDLIYVLGTTKDELGGSEYYALHECLGARVPQVDLKANKALYHALHAAMTDGLVASAHDCSDGGLGVALAECCIGSGFGASVKLTQVPQRAEDGASPSGPSSFLRDDKILFSESAGRFVVSVRPENKAKFEKAMEGTAFAVIGEVLENAELRIEGTRSGAPMSVPVGDLKSAHQRTITW
ncbi:Phosphoribosylformylglycinamidine synthase subunit PurL [uncultured archaeon]|nr:Phosphoribosylformylglycinamidine synthase subunit PurL [uncultured archaeon]